MRFAELGQAKDQGKERGDFNPEDHTGSSDLDSSLEATLELYYSKRSTKCAKLVGVHVQTTQFRPDNRLQYLKRPYLNMNQ
jgi:hypothetical protein